MTPGNVHNPAGVDWLFESLVSARKDNNRNLLYVCAAFLVVSFVSIAFNLEAFDQISFDLLSVEGNLTSAWPIRAMLSVACVVSYASVIYIVLEQQRLQLGMDYLATIEHSDAAALGLFTEWLEKNHPRVSKARSVVVGVFVTFCAAILLIDIATLIYSFSK
ncbi:MULTISPECIES: hypothetical protein [unclassified Ruegeria]|uniref:hypothetical protein n=1 Tax=unclassified Ruegeria TaxID=2625375 RepID=UPI00148829E0|nr:MULTISPECIES: hypothetical protein [unclassified Ruegeria]NOD46601.1 hypothetical protein [Ruegeria sp. HKCCD5849]NOD50099.1 hypothetical protein [Ruegeria sp. HKCCD5851]NOD66934.1 hypothetical protein [Ruegeria sp. HKCCD7303]